MSDRRIERITIASGKSGEFPCIRGNRFRVTDLLQLLAAGASYEEILSDYAFLEHENILAAFEYAAKQTERVVL